MAAALLPDPLGIGCVSGRRHSCTANEHVHALRSLRITFLIGLAMGVSIERVSESPGGKDGHAHGY